MTQEQIIKIIEEIMDIDLSNIDHNKKLDTIKEWDSFNSLMLISRLEEEYNIKFSVKEIEDSDTITKIIILTKGKSNEK